MRPLANTLLSQHMNRMREDKRVPFMPRQCSCGEDLVCRREQQRGYCDSCMVDLVFLAEEEIQSDSTSYTGERCGVCGTPLVGDESECGAFCSASHASQHYNNDWFQRFATPRKRDTSKPYHFGST